MRHGLHCPLLSSRRTRTTKELARHAARTPLSALPKCQKGESAGTALPGCSENVCMKIQPGHPKLMAEVVGIRLAAGGHAATTQTGRRGTCHHGAGLELSLTPGQVLPPTGDHGRRWHAWPRQDRRGTRRHCSDGPRLGARRHCPDPGPSSLCSRCYRWPEIMIADGVPSEQGEGRMPLGCLGMVVLRPVGCKQFLAFLLPLQACFRL